MRIVVNHLTRMSKGSVCVAGVDVETKTHVRPVLRVGQLPAELLASHGGPFDVAATVDLGPAMPRPEPPHVEDYLFTPSHAKRGPDVPEKAFWGLLNELKKPSLAAIFGPDLQSFGQTRGTEEEEGEASLGCLEPAQKPTIVLTNEGLGLQRIGMRFVDRGLVVNAPVTDIRLYKADCITPDPERVEAAAKIIEKSGHVLLSVGLTRAFSSVPGEPPVHWLQVNNFHVKEYPALRSL
jgi:hypothetical protein